MVVCLYSDHPLTPPPPARAFFLFQPQVGEHTLELFLMCDSYVGCDQEYAVDLMVGAAGSDDESDED